jgi:hypothetical protein
LFGRKAIHLVAGRFRRACIVVSRRPSSAFSEWLRHQRRCLRARGQRHCARGKSKSEFQKVAAFHGISLVGNLE